MRRRRPSSSPVVAPIHVHDIHDQSDQQCGLGEIDDEFTPVYQQSEWNGVVVRGMRIAYRFIKKCAGVDLFEWKIGRIVEVLKLPEVSTTNDRARVLVEFLSDDAFPGLATAPGSREHLCIGRSNFGDGTELTQEWFILVVRQDHDRERVAEAQTNFAEFLDRFSLVVGHAVPNGHCGRATLAQFWYGSETPQNMHHASCDLAAALRAHSMQIATSVAGSNLTVKRVEQELISRAQMHEQVDCRLGCGVDKYVGGAHGADFIAASLARPLRPIYCIKEGYPGGKKYHNGILSNFDIRTLDKIEDGAMFVYHVWGGTHFVPLLLRPQDTSGGASATVCSTSKTKRYRTDENPQAAALGGHHTPAGCPNRAPPMVASGQGLRAPQCISEYPALSSSVLNKDGIEVGAKRASYAVPGLPTSPVTDADERGGLIDEVSPVAVAAAAAAAAPHAPPPFASPHPFYSAYSAAADKTAGADVDADADADSDSDADASEKTAVVIEAVMSTFDGLSAGGASSISAPTAADLPPNCVELYFGSSAECFPRFLRGGDKPSCLRSTLPESLEQQIGVYSCILRGDAQVRQLHTPLVHYSASKSPVARHHH